MPVPNKIAMLSFFRKNEAHANAVAIYRVIASQARNGFFYTDLGVPDTVEGRYEMLTAHMYPVLRHLKNHDGASRDFAQTLFDVFFKNMDDSLRELGVGDMSIGRKIRAMAESFYGRVGAYEKGIESDDDGVLIDAVGRNIFNDPVHPKAALFADYLRVSIDHLDEIPIDQLLGGQVSFPDPKSSPKPGSKNNEPATTDEKVRS